MLNSSFRNGDLLGEGDEYSMILHNYRATIEKGNCWVQQNALKK